MISSIDYAFDLIASGVVEDKRNRFADRFRREAATLRLAVQRKSDLGFTSIRVKADSDVSDQPSRSVLCDAYLKPDTGLKQFSCARHVQIRRSLLISLRLPPLIQADTCISSVGLEVGQVSRRKSPEFYSLANDG